MDEKSAGGPYKLGILEECVFGWGIFFLGYKKSSGGKSSNPGYHFSAYK